MGRLKQLLLGKPRDIRDPEVFHKISLAAFLAWVGLGADGLSSSAYGPDEAFRTLGMHTHLALILVIMTAVTIFVISIAYSNLIEHFPGGGHRPSDPSPPQPAGAQRVRDGSRSHLPRLRRQPCIPDPLRDW